jgi:hypothetical protein
MKSKRQPFSLPLKNNLILAHRGGERDNGRRGEGGGERETEREREKERERRGQGNKTTGRKWLDVQVVVERGRTFQ